MLKWKYFYYFVCLYFAYSFLLLFYFFYYAIRRLPLKSLQTQISAHEDKIN